MKWLFEKGSSTVSPGAIHTPRRILGGSCEPNVLSIPISNQKVIGCKLNAYDKLFKWRFQHAFIAHSKWLYELEVFRPRMIGTITWSSSRKSSTSKIFVNGVDARCQWLSEFESFRDHRKINIRRSSWNRCETQYLDGDQVTNGRELDCILKHDWRTLLWQGGLPFAGRISQAAMLAVARGLTTSCNMLDPTIECLEWTVLPYTTKLLHLRPPLARKDYLNKYGWAAVRVTKVSIPCGRACASDRGLLTAQMKLHVRDGMRLHAKRLHETKLGATRWYKWITISSVSSVKLFQV